MKKSAAPILILVFLLVAVMLCGSVLVAVSKSFSVCCIRFS